jgi:hypothetical protein
LKLSHLSLPGSFSPRLYVSWKLRTVGEAPDRILKAGFSDVVLPTLAGCSGPWDVDVLAKALLPGV